MKKGRGIERDAIVYLMEMRIHKKRPSLAVVNFWGFCGVTRRVRGRVRASDRCRVRDKVMFE